MTEPAGGAGLREELAELAAAVRAYAEWQVDTGSDGLPIDVSPEAALALLAAPAAGARGGARRPAGAAPAGARPAAPAWAPPEPPRAPVAAPAIAAEGHGAAPAHATAGPRAAFQPGEIAPRAPDAAPIASAQFAPAGSPAPIVNASAASPIEAASPPPAAPSAVAPATAAATPDERRTRLALLAEEARSCEKCVLCQRRKQAVFARGNPFAELCFVGEGPGADEDAQGEPFVGRAGQLLDKMIAAMGYRRDEVYICNVVKCRPPENRKPEPAEIAACVPFLTQQLALVRPRVIVALGASAVEGLIGASGGITRMRGKWKLYKGSIPVMPTFHPAYLLRTPEAKRDVWNDLQEVMRHLGKAPPARA